MGWEERLQAQCAALGEAQAAAQLLSPPRRTPGRQQAGSSTPGGPLPSRTPERTR
jgi:hypothetical protein